ncbi:recombinase family protein [Alicyclobacillus sp. SO9]|uniref:recombinase family protein n=1 Tax=Alicyclobacillus sp. SO9 TaxID=2665646 RepID=UPI0018E81716|nr:recombinase family protein [Alicyclobacillus sp. SO9]QQE80240.1 recombinase family protein [Alicyclobacillus sp. SO9]
MKAALYTRVSTDIQAEEGFSLDAQLSRLRAYCESQAWEIYDIYTDEGESAKNLQRPGLQRMMAHIQEHHLDIVLVYRLDRLTRNVVDLHNFIQELEKHNVSFKSATEVFDTTSAMGRLFITIVAALAQWERENLGERVRMGQVEKIQQGKRTGAHAPFGYRYEGGELVPDGPAAQLVQDIFAKYLQGWGTMRLLRWLNDTTDPKLTPISGRWSQNTLRYLLDNDVYAGYVRYGFGSRSKGETIIEPGDHQPLIDKATWKHIQKLRQKKKSSPSRSGTGSYPLTGVLRCGRCGAPMIGKAKGHKTGRRYYMCSERNSSRTCDLPYIREFILNAMIRKEIQNIYEEQDNIDKPKRMELKNLKQSMDSKLEEIERRRSRWKDAFEEGLIEAVEMRERLDALQEQELELRAQREPVAKEIDYSEVELKLLKSFSRIWQEANMHEKKQVVNLLVRSITVYSVTQVSIAFA